MRDGHTQRLIRSDGALGADEFLRRHEARLIVVDGPDAGGQFRLRRERHILGRGPGVDLRIDDPALSRQHVALEYGDGGFRVRDLGSTNGMRVNERAVQVVELAPGDRLEIGSNVLQYLLERCEEEPEVYEIGEEA